MGENIPVSAIIRTHFCPVRFYLGRNEKSSESSRYLICKQLACHLGGSLDIDEIWQEVTAVKPDIDPSCRDFLAACILACHGGKWRPAHQTDVPVKSEKFGMYGMVDRLFADDTFSVVRAGSPPVAGIYTSDRLRVAAYALCLEEMMGRQVPGGYVEYISGGVARFCTTHPRDRRMLLRALNTTYKIMKGDVPQKPLNAPCSRCEYKERCSGDSGRRLSDLL